MKKLLVCATLVVMVAGLSGCACMQKWCGCSKCPAKTEAKGDMAKAKCPVCGMPMDQCKCVKK